MANEPLSRDTKFLAETLIEIGRTVNDLQNRIDAEENSNERYREENAKLQEHFKRYEAREVSNTSHLKKYSEEADRLRLELAERHRELHEAKEHITKLERSANHHLEKHYVALKLLRKSSLYREYKKLLKKAWL